MVTRGVWSHERLCGHIMCLCYHQRSVVREGASDLIRGGCDHSPASYDHTVIQGRPRGVCSH